MENFNQNYDYNEIIDTDFNDLGYSDPDMHNESVTEEDNFSDSYNFYPDSGF